MGLAPILVIDDESEMRSALSHALTRDGFAVESAASGTKALSKIKKGAVSLVITDLKMPEMSGMEVLGAVKKLAPEIPVIVITAYGSIHNAVEAMFSGGDNKRILRVSSLLTAAGAIQVTVSDTGPGLDAATIDSIFDTFYTTSKDGMGLGLAISRSIIEAHGGHLWAERPGGYGAIFHFTLPSVRGQIGGEQ